MKKSCFRALGWFGLFALAACAAPVPGPFYHTPATAAGPGKLVAMTPFSPSVPGAAAYLVIYNSRDEQGGIVPVSGVVYIPTAPAPPGGRNTVAWAHPTTGVAPGCAPTLDTGGIGGITTAYSIPGLRDFIAAGDVVAATDYQGLGEAGVHPYLMGRAEGQDIIDSVRAAKQLPGADLNGHYIVWGHSQGAQAVLFAGQIAAAYAPELHLEGVAAAAPVTDMQGELTEPFNNSSGRLLHAYVYETWSETYGVPITSVVAPSAVPAVQKTATKCINTLGQGFEGIRAASALNPVFLDHKPQNTPPWPGLFAENSPGHAPPGAPLLIVQGTKDPTVEPHWTETFAATVCARHETLDFVEFPGVKHLTIAYKSLPTVEPWIAGRFAGTPPPDNCPR